eukprot:TRINITY_DN81179_c0_g1_i1.p1 TRINITY_DN81179_c0_g1~~TRINITY_DN81179_c0_g1_i1.p1  ORF type:complete len:738 (-),score=120.47 TRINITY_DN81179_c0_g1_i1:9-2222(-)
MSARSRTDTPPPCADMRRRMPATSPSIDAGEVTAVAREVADAPCREPDAVGATSKDNDAASGETRRRTFLGFLPEHRIIFVALLGCALLLSIGPAAYCWLHAGNRADLADTYRHKAHNRGGPAAESHSCGTKAYTACEAKSSHHSHDLPLTIDRTYGAQVVSGGLNGLLLMTTTVLGGIGADLPGHGIMAVGAANLLAYGFSLGMGNFIVEMAKDEFSQRQLEEEYMEVKTEPEQEIAEMVCEYRKGGLSEEDAKTVANVISKYEDFWVQHMMVEELGVQLPRGSAAAASSSLATSLSFVGFGAVPLLGVVLSSVMSRVGGPQWYRPQFATMIAMALTAPILLAMGVLLSLVVGSRAALTNGLFLTAVGCAASVLALGVGEASTLFRLTPRPPAGCPTDEHAAAESNAGSWRKLTAPLDDAGRVTPRRAHVLPSLQRGWPSFRHMFLRGIFLLWVGVCTLIVTVQFLERVAYSSWRVFAYGWLTCITTGLGALPFAFIGEELAKSNGMKASNSVACGMMLAASVGMLQEAHGHSGPYDWQLFAGLAGGALFIKASEQLHGLTDDDTDGEEEDLEVLHKALMEKKDFKRAMLIFIVMFCHSAAEGVAVGVAFSRQLRDEFGLYVSLLLALHNVPEGLAVALVLVPKGLSTPVASAIAILTSMPQPFMALIAFLFVDAFTWLLPLGLAFAAGAMIYVCLHELFTEAAEAMGWPTAIGATSVSFVAMMAAQYFLQEYTGL